MVDRSVKKKPRLEEWKGKALKTGKRVEAQNWGVVDSADMTVEQTKVETGADGMPAGAQYKLSRVIVDHVTVFAFEGRCDRCSMGTPQPSQKTLRRSFDSGSCWIHPFRDWSPNGWFEICDGNTTKHLCPKCAEKTFDREESP